MSALAGIELVVFDMFGTLVRNETGDWRRALAEVVREQALPVEPGAFWETWSRHEVEFRKTRTNMADPGASPPFRSYWEAWRDAFTEAFAEMDIEGDAESAASRCVDALASRDAFPEAQEALDEIGATRPLAALSNADDRFLNGTIAHNGWSFPLVVSSEGAKCYKPDPRIFARFLQAAGVKPGAALYVGDSPYDDAHGAKLAGMRAALVSRAQTTPGRTPPPDGAALLPPDCVVRALTEIPALLG